LREGYVASISKISNAKTLFDTKEFVLIKEFDISDSYSNSAFFLFPVATSVFEPIEIVLIFDLVTFD